MEEVTIAIIFEHKKIRNGLWELIPKKYIIGEFLEIEVLDFTVPYFGNDDVVYEFANRSNFFYESVGYPITLTKSKNDSENKIEIIAEAYFEQVKKTKHFERVNKNGQKYFYQVTEDSRLLATNVIDYYSYSNSRLICNAICDESNALDMEQLFSILKTNKYSYERIVDKESKINNNEKDIASIREKYNSILNIPDAYKKLSKVIISQDKALKQVLLTIRNNIQKADKNYPLSNILLIGPTGVGKTLIAHEIANILQVPFVSVDATNCSPIGYKGSNIIDCLESLYIKANGDIELAQKGIVFIDEIDKLAIGDSHDYIKTSAIQESLLRMVEGQEYNLFVDKDRASITFNTAKVTFFAAGAFENITSPKFENSVGFQSQSLKVPNYKKDIDIKLIKYGMKSELMGRFIKILLDDLKVDDIIKIILSKGSIFNYYLELFRDYNIDFSYNDKFMEALAKYSMEKNGGARGINQVLETVFSECLWQIFDSEKSFSSLSVSEETVADPKKYSLK